MLFHITIKKLLQESNKWKHIFDNYLTKKNSKQYIQYYSICIQTNMQLIQDGRFSP